MSASVAKKHFAPVPAHLDEAQRRDWLRRQQIAENTLAIQDLGGTRPNAETIARFRRYVRGEITLAQAIMRMREQIAQDHPPFRHLASLRQRG